MIRIECIGAATLPLESIENFQGGLKKRTKKDFDRIEKSIRKYGFSAPFFVWRNDSRYLCIDGHGRLEALARMRDEGEELPEFPVVFIQAKDEEEAKQKLLRLNSLYGTITDVGLFDFLDGIEINFDEVVLPKNITPMTGESQEDILDTKPEKIKQNRVCPHCGEEI